MRGFPRVWPRNPRLAVAKGLWLVLLLLTVCGASWGQSVSITVYPAPGGPSGITAGPDGALWFTENDDKIGRITTAGTITEFPVPTTGSNPLSITAGPDSALWFTEPNGNKIGRITTAGVITEFTVPFPLEIAAGPDGALWFTRGDNKIGRITTAGVVSEYALPTPTSGLLDITVGPDGALWFTEYFTNRIGRIATSGTITEYAVPITTTTSCNGYQGVSGLQGIAAGPDGALWFTEAFGNKIGRITTSGTITEYPLATPDSCPVAITAGADGALWFGLQGASVVGTFGRITPTGTITIFGLPNPQSTSINGITLGPDGALWASDLDNAIERIVIGAFVTATSGNAQSAAIGSPFAIQLLATVRDFNNNPVSGIKVTFTAPSLGASATFAGSGITSTVQTNGSGVATAPTLTANTLPGTYVVSATLSGIASPAIFNLTNTPIGAALTITTASLPNGVVNATYPTTTLQAQGGTTPYSWSVVGLPLSTGLPPGLTLSPNGVLSGTPSTAGIFTPLIVVRDSSTPQQTAQKSLDLLVGTGPGANPSLPCTAFAVPAQTRAESIAELLGDIVVQCRLVGSTTGLPPSINATVVVRLNVNVTNNKDFGPGSSITDAVLVVNEVFGPAPITPTRNSTPSPIPNTPLPQYGTLTSVNTLQWNGVILPVPTVSGNPTTLVLRVTNMRGNVSQLGIPTGPGIFPVAQVTSSISISSQIPMPVFNNVLNIGIPLLGLTPRFGGPYLGNSDQESGTLPFVVLPGVTQFLDAANNISRNRDGSGVFPDFVDRSTFTHTDPGGAFSIRLSEGYAPAFKILGVSNVHPATAQVEDGFPTFQGCSTPNSGNCSGVNGGGATQGTRFIIRFYNVPNGVRIAIPVRLRGTVGAGHNLTLLRVGGTDAHGAGALSAAPTPSPEVRITGGFGFAVYEVIDPFAGAISEVENSTTVDSNPFGVEDVVVPVWVAYRNSAGGALQATVALAPVSSVTTSDKDAPEPRFVDIQPLAVVTSFLPSGIIGASYSATLIASGGLTPYRWSLSAGSLPPGLSLDSSTGQVSGTPASVGSFNFTVQVTDGSSQTASKPFSLVVSLPSPPPVTITIGVGLPSGTVGVPYSAGLSASGGTPPYRWSLVDGSPPPGLSLGSSGAVSGTPTTVGNFYFTAEVTDSAGASNSSTFAITINPAPLTITTSTLASGVVGTPYSEGLAASGGTLPYRWFIDEGSLPPGLSLGSTGGIGGSPTAAGSFTFTVRVADSGGKSATKDFTVTIVAALTITTDSLPSGAVGTAYGEGLSASGGKPPYTWSVDGGSLPAGLSLATSSGGIGGTPTTAGSFTFTALVTDSNRARATKEFTILITPPLVITTGSLASGKVGVAYSQGLSATGGKQPYSWSISADSLPPGLALDSSSGAISGTPSSPGQFGFTVRVTDTARGSSTKRFSITVATDLTITTDSLGGGEVGRPYSAGLAASGGRPPYTWAVPDGSLPPGLGVNSSSGGIAGTPTEPGTFSFTAEVTDSARFTATKGFSITIALPPAPSVTVGLPGPSGGGPMTPVGPAQQPDIVVGSNGTFPVPILGQITLTFTPDAVIPSDDPAVQFSSGGRRVNFTIPANSTQADFGVPAVAVQTGTVAGTITLTVTLQAGGRDVTPTPPPTRIIRIERSAPVITGMRVNRITSGFEVLLSGYSTPRQITQATFRLTPAAGSNLQTTELTLDVGGLFTRWYQDPASSQFGGLFTFAQSFTIQGDLNAISSVSVTLTNAQGTSQPALAGF